MTDRDKLIHKIMSLNKPTISLQTAMDIVDAIIDEGVIVPPCKVGDTMYVLLKNGFSDKDYGYKSGVNEIKVHTIKIRKDGILVSDFWGFLDWKIGERAFRTKDEAKQKLKELNKQ